MTSVLLAWHYCALWGLAPIAIVPIVAICCSSPEGASRSRLGVCMRFMHLCYAALGFAVARLIFRRQPVPVTDPVTRLRSSGLL
jgi:hypothetical protein